MLLRSKLSNKLNGTAQLFVGKKSNSSDPRTATVTVGGDVSDLSNDDDDTLYPSKTKVKDMKFIRPKLKSTSSPKIKQLFSNTNKVTTSNIHL